jgi:cytochrome c peroxidase
MFKAAFGDQKITLDRVAKAIATYERTVVGGKSPFDRWAAGNETAISASAKRGFGIFNEKGRCSVCHSSWRFTDDSFHDIGLASKDIGRGKLFPNIVKIKHAFKTPGLADIARRGPYMHDGSLPDLMAVVRHYNEGGMKRPNLSDEMRPLKLTEQKMKDLVAFMESLTGLSAPVPYVSLPG